MGVFDLIFNRSTQPVAITCSLSVLAGLTRSFKPSYVKKRDYKTLSLLGSGAQGTVKHCIHLPSGRHVAIKSVRKANSYFTSQPRDETTDSFSKLPRELQILASIKHRNVVELLDWFESRSKYYLVFELMTGGQLFDHITLKGNFTERDAAVIVATLASTVAFLHDLDVIHRDIKTSNLLFRDSASSDPDLVLVDFGFATRIAGKQNLAPGSLGAVHSRAPELFREVPYGKEVDLWALGLVAYTLLVGSSPFAHCRRMSDLSNHIVNASFSFPAGTSLCAPAIDFVSHLIVANPANRMKAREALDHEWIRTMVPPEYLEYLYVVEQEAWGWQRSVRRKIEALNAEPAPETLSSELDGLDIGTGVEPVSVPGKRWDADPLVPLTPTWMDIKLPPTPPPHNPEAYRSAILDELDDGVPFGSSMHDYGGPDGVQTSAAMVAGAHPVARRPGSGTLSVGEFSGVERGRSGRPDTPEPLEGDLPDLSSGFSSNIQNALKRLNSIGTNLKDIFQSSSGPQPPISPILDRERPASPSARFQEQADAFDDSRRRSRSRSIDLSSLSSAQPLSTTPGLIKPKAMPFAGSLAELDGEESWRLPMEGSGGRRMSTGSLSSLEDGL